MRFTSFGDNGWRLNCGAGDLLVGLNQADLEAPLGQLVERVAADGPRGGKPSSPLYPLKKVSRSPVPRISSRVGCSIQKSVRSGEGRWACSNWPMARSWSRMMVGGRSGGCLTKGKPISNDISPRRAFYPELPDPLGFFQGAQLRVIDLKEYFSALIDIIYISASF